MSPAEEMEYLDGPKLMKWLKEVESDLWEGKTRNGQRGRVTLVLGDSWNRRFYNWERGSRPDVYIVDRLCVKLGRHILEIPDDVWLEARPIRRSPERQWKVDRALEMLDEGYLPAEVARELGLNIKTIYRWRDERVAA